MPKLSGSPRSSRIASTGSERGDGVVEPRHAPHDHRRLDPAEPRRHDQRIGVVVFDKQQADGSGGRHGGRR